MAALTREIDKSHPTLLWDEADQADKEMRETLSAVLNDGYRKSKSGGRAVVEGKDNHVIRLETFCPKAFAGIGFNSIAETLKSRSIPIRLVKKSKHDKIERFRRKPVEKVFEPLHDALVAWATNERGWEPVINMEPPQPQELGDRQLDITEPLFAIAELAGGDWPTLMRQAALTLLTQGNDELGTKEQLLLDIRTVIGEREYIASNDLIEALVAMEDKPWATFTRNLPMQATALARQLKQFDKPDGTRIKPTMIRMNVGTLRGYYAWDFKDAWERYVPEYSVTGETSETEPLNSPSDVADVSGVTDVSPNTDTYTPPDLSVEIPDEEEL